MKCVPINSGTRRARILSKKPGLKQHQSINQASQPAMDKVTKIASEHGVVIFSKSSCCLCYAVNILFQELGVTPFECQVDQDPDGRDAEKALSRMGCNPPVPAVFIGGKFVGSTNEIMSLHLSGSLMPMLKPYQAHN